MNTMYLHSRNRTRSGFTLVELLVVIAIIALLASLTIGAFRYAQVASARNRTSATQVALSGGLERYKAEFGEFPAPANANDTETFNTKKYTAGGAAMLYQAMSGDGSDAIQLASGGTGGSNGQIEEDEEGNVMMSDIPSEIFTQVGNRYFIIDGFRKPFQYTKGGQPDAVNPTYDLWSFGEDDTNTEGTSLSQKTNPQISAKWIVNW